MRICVVESQHRRTGFISFLFFIFSSHLWKHPQTQCGLCPAFALCEGSWKSRETAMTFFFLKFEDARRHTGRHARTHACTLAHSYTGTLAYRYTRIRVQSLLARTGVSLHTNTDKHRQTQTNTLSRFLSFFLSPSLSLSLSLPLPLSLPLSLSLSLSLSLT